MQGQRRENVNGIFVGVWSGMESNPYFTFTQSEFSIPAHATSDSTHITLSLEIFHRLLLLVAVSSRWDFIPDALNSVWPMGLAQGARTWDEIAWEVFSV